MIDAHTMRRLAALKLSPEAMSEVLEILAEASEADDLRRQKRRDQKRRERDCRATVARLSHDKDSDKGYDSRSDIPPKRKVPPHPPKENNPPAFESSLRSDSNGDARAERVPPQNGRQRKGTRIPDGYQPDLGEALALGLGMPRALTEAANFRDYWTAKPGAAGVKLDWEATWRVWCRKAAGDAATGPGPPTTPAAPTVWITEDDPRWPAFRRRWQEAKGHLVSARGSRYEPGIGHHFPAEWAGDG